jgi:OFA family oxalate/formate antiporter-like MFS transporter
MLYTAKGAGALLVPIAAGISKAHGWSTIFALAMTFNVIAAILALFVLRPMRARHFAKGHAPYATASDGVVSTRTT